MALTAALISTTASARLNTAHDATPATCDSLTLVHHQHRARANFREAYDLANDKPDRSAIRAGQQHRRCIEIRSVRKAIGDYRDHVKARWSATHEFPTPESLGVSSSTLDAIAACESGGDPGAVDASGTYYGLFQFDLGTWASVGGSGSPAAASVAEQYYRAALLYRSRGSAPWPVCGR